MISIPLAFPPPFAGTSALELRNLHKPQADNYLAPWRNEKNPSLSIFRGQDGVPRWKDHGSDEGGDAIDLAALEWTREDLSTSLIYLDSQHTKTRKRRAVPINNAARQALVSRADFHAHHCPSPWVFFHAHGERIQSVKKSFASVCQQVGIHDFHIHDMRHTTGSRLVQSGTPLHVVRDTLGHRSVRSTERYAHRAPEQARKALERLDRATKEEGEGDS